MINQIRDYCIIRKNKVFHQDHLYFAAANENSSAGFLTELYKHTGINYPKFYKMDQLSRLGFLGSEILFEGKSLMQQYKGDDVGIILYNASSSLDTDRIHQQSIADRSAYFPSPSVFVYTLANIVTGEICIRNKIFGEGTFFITRQFNASMVYDYVSQLLDADMVKCCLTGWLEIDKDHCDAVLYLIEKTEANTNGIANFEPQKIEEIYLQQI